MAAPCCSGAPHESRICHLMSVHGRNRSSIPRLARVRDGHQTKRRRAAAQKKQACAERVALRRAKQDLITTKVTSALPRPLEAYLFTIAEAPQVRWQCGSVSVRFGLMSFPLTLMPCTGLVRFTCLKLTALTSPLV